jgi:phosphoadenosine phosphosulfate reductase
VPLFEAEGERVKVNPLVGWSATEILAYIREARLPPHPLAAKGYPSIGCLPCTSAVRPGEDSRAGRWRGRGKIECGIHADALSAGQDI